LGLTIDFEKLPARHSLSIFSNSLINFSILRISQSEKTNKCYQKYCETWLLTILKRLFPNLYKKTMELLCNTTLTFVFLSSNSGYQIMKFRTPLIELTDSSRWRELYLFILKQIKSPSEPDKPRPCCLKTIRITIKPKN